MTTFNVHIYRELRLKFEGIEADTPEAAAAIAAEKPTGDADHIEDCEGESLSALVDVEGDEDYSQSVTIDFEAERARRVAPKVLDALKLCHEQLSLWVADTETCDLSPEDEEALAKASYAIAEANTAGILPVPAVVTPRLRQTLEDVAEWLETGKIDGVSFDEASIFATVRETLSTANAADTPTIRVEVRGVVVQQVSDVPPGWTYEIVDYDDLEAAGEEA